MRNAPTPVPAYTIDGDGPWLTLLHGFSQDSTIWDAAAEQLEEQFRVLRIDLRGHGRSSSFPGPFGPREYLADVLAALNHAEVPATHLWGTHTGAGIALLLAAEHPDRVGGLILEGAVIPGVPVPPVDEWHARMRTLLAEQGAEAAVATWWEQAPFFTHARQLAAERNRSEMREAILRFTAAPWSDTTLPAPLPPAPGMLAAVRAPTLLLNGADDMPEFLVIAKQLERSLTTVRRVVVPNVGAFPGWEAPEVVAPVVATFLDEVD